MDGNIMTRIFMRKQTSSKFDIMIYPIVWPTVSVTIYPGASCHFLSSVTIFTINQRLLIACTEIIVQYQVH